MRVVMIHALVESMSPVKGAFKEEFPEAELINVLDEGLFIDFQGKITPGLRRRMSQLICYCAEHSASAIGLACSVYAPVVDTAQELVDIPVISSYGPVMDEAVKYGRRVGIIASVPATLRDAEYYLRRSAAEHGVAVETQLCLAEDLIPVLRMEGDSAFHRRLAEEVNRMALSSVDVVLLSQFSMASALTYLRASADVPVLSAPHSSARRLKELLAGATH
jgi:Asp/Glu/hydantoin racemase